MSLFSSDLLTGELRIALFLGALFTLWFFFRQISRSRMQIDSAVSWSIFSGVMLLVSIFPDSMMVAARFVGIQSPSNLVFLIVFGVLIFQQFFTTLKLSKLEQQITELTQELAVRAQMEKEVQQRAEKAKCKQAMTKKYALDPPMEQKNQK